MNKNKELDNKFASHDVRSISTMANQDEVLEFFTSSHPNDINQYFSNTPHILHSLTIGLCIEGSARIKLNTIEQKLHHHQLIFLLPNTIVDPLEVTTNFRLHSIVFDYNFIASLPLLHRLYMDNTIRLHPILNLKIKDYTLIEQLFSLINQYYHQEELPNKNEVIIHLLSALINELNRLHSTEPRHCKPSRVEMITNSFFTLLFKNYAKERRSSFYANQLNISPKYLTTIIRQKTGKSISDWINELTITYAKTLLKSTNRPITQISDDLGFAEPTLFARYFKRYTSMTPSEFRKN